MNEEGLLYLWGKTVRQEPTRYHPVLFHLLDVGHCAALLWDESLSDRRKATLATELAMTQSDLRRAVIWLAAWHDIGKISPGFQFQTQSTHWNKFGPQWIWEELKNAGFNWSPSQASRPHAQISARILIDSLKNGEAGWRVPDAQTALICAHIVGAHHGTFPHSGETRFGSDILGNVIWHEARIEIMKVATRLLTPEAPDETLQTPSWPSKNGGAVGWLAGLIAVADWLGSSDHFSAEGEQNQKTVSSTEYFQVSKNRARKALKELGWLPGFQPNRAQFYFKSTFGFEPNSLQKAVLDCTQNLDTPFFAIAEAPMGVGKTEAAFTAIDAALRNELASGFYIALPTQATSNAMHDRARDNYLRKRQSHNEFLNLLLAHSGALLKDSDQEEEIEIPAGSIAPDGDKTAATVAAQSWFTARKRPLLAPFGVGTIDQSLMGVLQTKHWFVRIFGLSNKVIVFDEVHAYDTYMSTLLDRLLTWLRQSGCSVILLSATLPSSRRKQLIEAWGATAPEREEDYPRLTWIDEHGAQSISIADPQTKAKTITLHFAPGDGSTLSATLREKLKDGGSAAIICNTVKSAQTLYQKLKTELGEDFCDEGEWHLFHARMPFSWRQEREAKILKSFGKDKSHRPHRAIAISTQVMEQSLDLCFSWMASELAPVDLLLQRVGRLHRHEHTTHPPLLQEPELTILCDGGQDGAIPELPKYEMYSHFILLQTWLALRSRKVLRVPDEIESLIEAVYENGLDTPDEVWKSALESALEKMKASHGEADGKAKHQLVKKPSNARSIANAPSRELHEDDDPATHETMRATTRDGAPSIQVVCLVREDDQLFLPLLDGTADRSRLVDLNFSPDRAQSRALLRNALPLSNRALYFALRTQAAPEGWKENVHLRFARALEFRNGQAEIAGQTLRLDGELGLVIEKSE